MPNPLLLMAVLVEGAPAAVKIPSSVFMNDCIRHALWLFEYT
jgi:hypothetical protein